MAYEALWYSMYSAKGSAPHCTRYCRLPMAQQWDLAVDLAISFVRGEAGYRQTFISLTREVYWYWPHPLSTTGWWLIPDRIQRRAFALEARACDEVFRRNNSRADVWQIEAVLRNWKRTGAWKKHAVSIAPRHEEPASHGKKQQRVMERCEQIRAAVAKRRAEVAAGIVAPAPAPIEHRAAPSPIRPPSRCLCGSYTAYYARKIGHVCSAADSPRRRGRKPPAPKSQGEQAGHHERNAEILAMREGGATLQQCATRFGITRERARQIVKRCGAKVE